MEQELKYFVWPPFQYKSVAVPFPKDKDNLKGAVEKEEKEEVCF